MSRTAERLTDTRVTRVFAQAKAEGRAVLMPFVTIGWPKLGDTERLIPALIEGGADLIEIGIPFSDPIADGPTIQRVSQQALENGVTPVMAVDVVQKLRAEAGVEAPLLFMGYYNPILAYGLEKFVADAAGAGVDGLIVPDLPPEESDQLLEACRTSGIHLIYFLAPTSTEERMAAVLERANGFIYLIALVGVTGARDQLRQGLPDYVARVRRHTDLPLAIGFGISTRAQVAEAEKLVDGVICASALLDRLSRTRDADLPAEAKAFVRALRGNEL
jgi:tryptophan synthase alpha chain